MTSPDNLQGFCGKSVQNAKAEHSSRGRELIPNRRQRFGFSFWLYRQRNLVKRFFNRIKQFRGIATRCDKDAANYLAAIKLICTRLWCNA